MLSKFFIDRPIFATVLSVVITLTGVLALYYLPIAQYPRITPPAVQVSIAYPGASAQVVADTVAAPIEQQVTGVPGMLYMSSQMSNDGSYSLSVTFDVDVDLNTALVMVQNRVALAMPLLPTPVQNQGITIRKKTPDILCMINLISAVDVTTRDGKAHRGVIIKDDDKTMTIVIKDAEGRLQKFNRSEVEVSGPVHDNLFLSNYALINLKDEILRVDGVSDVSIMGERDYSIRAWLDPQKLASRNMTAGDVANAIRNQNLQAAAGQIGSPPMRSGQSEQMPIDTLGRLSDPEQFGNIVVKVVPSQPPVTTARTPGGVAPRDGDDGMMTPELTPSLVPGGTLVGGANSPGGGTTGGGANSPGGGTTGGAALDPAVLISASSLLRPKKDTTERPRVSTAAARKGPVATAPAPAVSIVRLKDVARVEMGALNYSTSCMFDGAPSVGLSVYQLPGTNALDVADRVRAKMKKLKRAFPDGVDYMIAYDTSPFIRESISEVFSTLRDAVLLVAIVVLLFLQDWRAMILPMIDVPVALIGTFAVMAVMGYSLNNISLFGRRHRRPGEHRTATGEGLRHAHGHDQGDGGNHRPHPGDHAGPVRGLHSVRLHQRHHRAILSPVRSDHCCFDCHLSDQRSDDDAVARAGDLQEEWRRVRSRSDRTTRAQEGGVALVDLWPAGDRDDELWRRSAGERPGPGVDAFGRRRRRCGCQLGWLGGQGALLRAWHGHRSRRRLVLHRAGQRGARRLLPRLQPRLR
jgi:multidrug efflux pump